MSQTRKELSPMADIVGTYDEVKGHEGSNIRKVLRMSVFVAPATAPVIASLVNATNQAVIPDAYESVGILDKENALTTTPGITVSEVSGYGYGTTLRRDIVGRNTSVAFTMLESRRRTFEMYYGIDLSAVVASSAAGGKNELVFDEPDRPDTLYWRVLCLGADGDGANTIYIADYYPRATITDVAAMGSSETDPKRYGVTLGIDVDTDVGTGHRQFWAGPGLTTAKIADMGFTRAA